MILVTGAGGKTGLAVLRALHARGVVTKALVHQEDQTQRVMSAGATEVAIGSLLDQEGIYAAMRGAQAVYLICPNVNPQELGMVKLAVAAARRAHVASIVYHSVLLPEVEAMPHHWQKHLAEQELKSSGLDYTILQPASYMQNVLPYWETMKASGEYRVPYSTNAVFTPVDLDDVAEVAAMILTERAQTRISFELSGPEKLSSIEMAGLVSAVIGRRIRAVRQPLPDWQENARVAGLEAYAMEALSLMFQYYESHGLAGDSADLESLLARRANTFMDFLQRQASSRA